MFRPSSTPVAGGRYGYQTKLTLLFVQLRFDRGFDFFVKRLVVLQSFLRSVPALGKLSALVVQPRAALFDNLFFQGDIEKRAGRGNSLVIHDVELGLGEWRRYLVLLHFDARAITRDDAVGLLNCPDSADIDPHTGVKLSSSSARSR